MIDRIKITISKNQIVAFISILLLSLYCYTYGGLKRYIFNSLIVSIIAFVIIIVGMLYLSHGTINKKSVPLIVLISACAFLIVFNRNANFLNNVYENDIAILFILLFLIIAIGCSEWHRFFILFSFFAAAIHSSFTLLEYIIPGFYKSIILPLFRNTMYYSDLVLVFSKNKMPGLAGHFSTNGMYLSVGLVIASIYFMTCKQKKKISLLFVIIVAVALLLTGKRAVLIFGIAGIFFAYYCLNADKPAKRFVKIIGIALIILAAFAIASQYIPALSNFLDRFSETSNRGDITTGRSDLYLIAYRLFSSKPLLGIGWDAYKYLYLSSHGVILNVHNVYLQLLTENGIIGAVFFYTLFLYLYVRAVKALVRHVKKRTEKNSKVDFALCLSVGMQTMFLLYCMTGNPLYDPPVFFPYICCCAMGEYYILNMQKVLKGEIV